MTYEAPWWLPGGNLQTIWAALQAERYVGNAPACRRERWVTPDHDFVDVDFLVDAQQPFSEAPPQEKSAPSGGSALHDMKSVAAKPLLVVFHGLEGSSGSHYAQALADAARARGWACAVQGN